MKYSKEFISKVATLGERGKYILSLIQAKHDYDVYWYFNNNRFSINSVIPQDLELVAAALRKKAGSERVWAVLQEQAQFNNVCENYMTSYGNSFIKKMSLPKAS